MLLECCHLSWSHLMPEKSNKHFKPIIIHRGNRTILPSTNSGKEFIAQAALGLLHRFYCIINIYNYRNLKDKLCTLPKDTQEIKCYVWAKDQTSAVFQFEQYIKKLQKDPTHSLPEGKLYMGIRIYPATPKKKKDV